MTMHKLGRFIDELLDRQVQNIVSEHNQLESEYDQHISAFDLISTIQPIDASVAANALTLTLNETVLDFRSSTLGSGSVNTRTISSPISVVVSSGSTLGTTSAVQSRLAVIAIDNAGTVELAVINLVGGNNLDETTLISTTAEGGAGAADSNNVFYSTTARTNVPFRVVGFVVSTQTVAGTWATAPSTIQGYGGNLHLGPVNTVDASRAWVSFKGTGTVTIHNSFNVSSITDSGTGQYRVNFATAMPHYYYATVFGACRSQGVGTIGFATSNANRCYSIAGQTTTQVGIQGCINNLTFEDQEYLAVSVFCDMEGA